jgi:hypothetical protein
MTQLPLRQILLQFQELTPEEEDLLRAILFLLRQVNRTHRRGKLALVCGKAECQELLQTGLYFQPTKNSRGVKFNK